MGVSTSSQIFKPLQKKNSRSSIIIAFSCVVLFASNLVLKRLIKVLKRGTIFRRNVLTIGGTLRAKTYS